MEYVLYAVAFAIPPGLFVYGILSLVLCRVTTVNRTRGIVQDLLYVFLLPAAGLSFLLYAEMNDYHSIDWPDLGRLTVLAIAGGLIAGIGRALLLRAHVDNLRTIEAVRLMLALVALGGVWFIK